MRIAFVLALLAALGCSGADPGQVKDGGPKEVAGQGDLRMTVLLIQKVDSPGFRGMQTWVLAENRSDTRLIKFFETPQDSSKPYKFTATDEFGNSYTPEPRSEIHTAKAKFRASKDLEPGKFIIYCLSSGGPIDKATSLNFNLPSLVVKSQERFKLKVSLKRETIELAVPLAMLEYPADYYLSDNAWKDGKSDVLFRHPDFYSWHTKWEDQRSIK